MTKWIFSELFPALWNMSVTAGIVVLALLPVRLALRRAPKVFSYALWAVVLFRLLCPVSITAQHSLLGLLQAPVREAAPVISAVEYIRPSLSPADEVNGITLPVPDAVPPVSEAPAPQQSQQSAPGVQTPPAAAPFQTEPVVIVTAVWMAGILALLGRCAVTLLQLRRRLVGAAPLRGNIYQADHIDSPFVMGLLRPRIYLPSSLTEQEREYIILHEQCHIRRLDHIIRPLAFTALCLHWFNPLAWLAFVLSGKDMEMSCDEAVVRRLGSSIRADYSASLLSLTIGRRVIAGMPLAFGEGDTAARIRNLLHWKKPRMWITAAAAVVCVVAIAACAANPGGGRETPSSDTSDTAAMTGRYASMEDFAHQTLDSKKEATYYSASKGESTAKVTASRIDSLVKRGEVAALAPDGVLEAWTFQYLLQIDADPADIQPVGGMYEEDGWFDLEGQGGRNIVALRYDDGSYDILYNAWINDNMDFFGYHHSYEEAIYDWYVVEKDLDLPLYVEDWTDRVTVPEGGHLGNFPVHRFDGESWYLYIPVQAWKQAEVDTALTDDGWMWKSEYGTGSALSVGRLYAPLQDEFTAIEQRGYTPMDATRQVWTNHIDGITSFFYYIPDSAGGYWRVTIRWNEPAITDYPYIAIEPDVLRLMAESFTVDDHSAAVQLSYGTAQDAAYYLELAAGESFRNMAPEQQSSLLAEYEDLLDDYTLIARETEGGKTAYIVGQYNGDPVDGLLYRMYSVEVSMGDDEFFQFLYREEASEAVDAVLSANKNEFPPSAGYRIENSSIYWSSNSDIILIQPKENELLLDVPWNRYLFTPNGREYIADAVSRGIDVCGRTNTYLYVYMISERFGELAERISLTETEAQAILAEDRVSITEGFGFSATLHLDGETIYYNEREGIPQTVLDLAVEKCDYRFGDPSYITDTIREARLDCDWLEAPLYAAEADLPRLREILKNAEHGYVGACGYGAKLTLTFTGGEKLTIFKGTDGCDSVVFGSYGGYFIGDPENTEFWEMFGLDPNTKAPLGAAEQNAFPDILGYSGYIVSDGGSPWEMRTYYAVVGDEARPIAESFGFGEAQDHAVDLDGDGVTELVTNVTYGGDGARRAYVYQRRGNTIYRGTLSTEDLPDFNDWGANAFWSEYDAEAGIFRLHYAQKSSNDEAVREYSGLENFHFEVFQPAAAIAQDASA